MNTVAKSLYPLGRAFLGALFLVSGLFKVIGFAGVAGWMASAGLPAPEVLLAITIAIEVIGGLMLATVATLLFVPVVFSLVHGRKKNRAAAGESSHVV